MTEPVHPPESQSPFSPALPFGSAAELLTRITAQLGAQLSGVRPPRARTQGAPSCVPPSSPWPTSAATRAPRPPSSPSSNGSAGSVRVSASGSGPSS
ncbi:hypothetical protein PL81_26085 [Streptomyces sp. RSD-27]|nr:hypothetical protein PL81_26085 [Streptomyces sp. RSD-27]